MKSYSSDMTLAARFSSLEQQMRQSWADLARPALAADAVYDLRLGLRISRILRHFVRKDPAFAEASTVLDQCYRATSQVRDRQVGIGLIRELEQRWPRNRRRPSTALGRDIVKRYRDLKRTADVLGLDRALVDMRDALNELERRVSGKKLCRRSLRQAKKLDRAMIEAMHRALKRQRGRDWHALRLAIKHYRFWVMTLEDWLPARYREAAHALKPLQVALGDYHDWEVLEKWLPELPDVPLDAWLLALAEHKEAARARALEALAPLLSLADAPR
jgi:CHAD domain-containing protein